VQTHTQVTKQGYVTQNEAEPKTPNPRTGRKAGLPSAVEGDLSPKIDHAMECTSAPVQIFMHGNSGKRQHTSPMANR
jgi:hypothetical protein